MTLIDFILIVEDRNNSGEKIFRRCDNREIIPEENIEMIKESPTMIYLENRQPFPKTKTKLVDFEYGKANALLVGAKNLLFDEENCYSASYCKIQN